MSTLIKFDPISNRFQIVEDGEIVASKISLQEAEDWLNDHDKTVGFGDHTPDFIYKTWRPKPLAEDKDAIE
jgi:membrane-bound lytic murein transglycosylase